MIDHRAIMSEHLVKLSSNDLGGRARIPDKREPYLPDSKIFALRAALLALSNCKGWLF